VTKWPILLLVRELGHGGCERDTTKLAIALKDTCFEPHVGAFHEEDGFRAAELKAAGIPVLFLPVRSFMNSTATTGARILHDYIRQHQIRLVHAFDVALDVFGCFAARQHVPVLITAQLSYRDMYPWIFRAALRITDWMADRVVVNSAAVGDSLTRQIGFPESKLYLCYNGVDSSVFYPATVPRPKPVADAELLIGSVCVMRREKRVDWMLRSFHELWKQYPGLRMLLVGNGPEAPRWMELRDRLGLRNVCHFEPGRQDIADFMRAIDVYLNTSYSESFPNALLEAMACGCCVIGSNVGGIPELVTHRQDGFVFDSQDPDHLTRLLREAVENRSLRESIRREAVTTAHERFSMRITAEKTMSLYKTLLNERGVRQVERP
jgi:glycosyltransferase involved in cell wall biosynthesis